MKLINSFKVSLTLSILLITSCTKEPSDDSSSGGSTGGSGGNKGEVVTDCGIVNEGGLQNPVALNDGMAVRVKEVVGNNLVILEAKNIQSEETGEMLVKLHGLAATPSSTSTGAINMLKNMASGDVRFYKASENCTTTLQGGGQGFVGQLVTETSGSFTEKLIKTGLVDVDVADVCGGDKIAPCLTALHSSQTETAGEMREFLWKPKSDTKGNIVVIHEDHCGAEAIVNGEVLEYKGAGNGRCGTYAGKKHGCNYGANIKVQLRDRKSGQYYTHNGEPHVIVPNGCQRFEFK